ncbi:MAG: hydroxyacylglutathione hydrolase [Boseongicola sp.]
MTFKLLTIPCLSDNYAFLLHGNGKTALVDAPEAAPVANALAANGWDLDEIWLTHHHHDHTGAVKELRTDSGAIVRGAKADLRRLPALDSELVDGEVFQFAGSDVHVLDVSGHTVGHIAFHVPEAKAVFTADSLMALGCGRLFEGSAEQMWASLSKLAALPPDTQVCSGHEYTSANANFALTIEPGNAALQERAEFIAEARATGRPTVPSMLSTELETNPFLRAGLQSVKDTLNMSDKSDVAVFAEIRRRKDSF